jgi:hypothetical protein
MDAARRCHRWPIRRPPGPQHRTLRAIWGSISWADRLAEKGMTLAVGNVVKGRILVPTRARQWQECANSGHSPTAWRTCQIGPVAALQDRPYERAVSARKRSSAEGVGGGNTGHSPGALGRARSAEPTNRKAGQVAATERLSRQVM